MGNMKKLLLSIGFVLCCLFCNAQTWNVKCYEMYNEIGDSLHFIESDGLRLTLINDCIILGDQTYYTISKETYTTKKGEQINSFFGHDQDGQDVYLVFIKLGKHEEFAVHYFDGYVTYIIEKL